MSVTISPLPVVAELNEPPLGLMLQVTRAASFVVAESDKCWLTVTPELGG
jgi:hypothetical protein